MRIKIYSLVGERDRKPPVLDVDTAITALRVRVWHGDGCYELSEDADGRLVLREVEGRQLHIDPRASNEVHLSAEPWS